MRACLAEPFNDQLVQDPDILRFINEDVGIATREYAQDLGLFAEGEVGPVARQLVGVSPSFPKAAAALGPLLILVSMPEFW